MEVYKEVQNSKPVWILGIVIVVSLITWWGFIQQIILRQPWGTNPAPDWVMWLLALLIGFGIPVFYVIVKLEIVVDDTTVHVSYFPITERDIPLSEIKMAQAVTYNPIAEYGGWGVRMRPTKRAYSMMGNRGVELQLESGQTVLLGSETPEQLAAAVQAQLAR